MLTKKKISDINARNEADWDKYFGADVTERKLREGVQDSDEVFFNVGKFEWENIEVVGDKVLVDIDELVEMTYGGMRLKLPEHFGDDQHNTRHQSVSGVVVAGVFDKGIRVFFHYNCIVAAKTRLAGSGIFIECDGKGYILLPKKVFYVGIKDGELVSLHPDFCITEAIEIADKVEIAELVSAGGVVMNRLASKEYEPFMCKIVALPLDTRENTLVRIKDTGDFSLTEIKVGDIVNCRRAWDIPIENGIQEYFDGKKYFRTRIAAIKSIIE